MKLLLAGIIYNDDEGYHMIICTLRRELAPASSKNGNKHYSSKNNQIQVSILHLDGQSNVEKLTKREHLREKVMTSNESFISWKL